MFKRLITWIRIHLGIDPPLMYLNPLWGDWVGFSTYVWFAYEPGILMDPITIEDLGVWL